MQFRPRLHHLLWGVVASQAVVIALLAATLLSVRDIPYPADAYDIAREIDVPDMRQIESALTQLQYEVEEATSAAQAAERAASSNGPVYAPRCS